MGCAGSVNFQQRDDLKIDRSNSSDIGQKRKSERQLSDKVTVAPRELSSSTTSPSKVTIVTPSVSLQKTDDNRIKGSTTEAGTSDKMLHGGASVKSLESTSSSVVKGDASVKSKPPAPGSPSSSARKGKEENSTNEANSNQNSTLTTAKSIYKAIKVGTIILIRDSFHSKYSGKLMYKWREAEIIQLDEANPRRIFIHFIGWNSTFDTWLDMEEDIDRIAPIGLLTKPEIEDGVALDTAQMQLVKYYLLTGNSVNQSHLQHSFMTSTTGGEGGGVNSGPGSVPGSTASSTNNLTASALSSPHPYPSNVTSAVNSPTNTRLYTLQKAYSTEGIRPPASYEVGQLLDVLDIFYRPGSDTPAAKWRKSKIIDKRENKIRVTYLGWDSKFDETLDIYENANRISAFGTKSTEQTSIAAAVAQKTPDSNRKKSKFTFSFTTEGEPNLSEGDHLSRRPEEPVRSTAGTEEPEEEEEEEEEDEGNELTEEEGDSISSSDRKKRHQDHQSERQKDKKRKTKKGKTTSFGKQFGKMMSNVMSTFSTTSHRSSGNGHIRPQSDHSMGEKSSDKGSARKRPSNTSSTTPAPGAATSGNSLLDHEATAEEIAAFEAEINKERVFIHTLQAHGYHVLEIEGDGNCLFRAISHQLYLNEEYHEQLRYCCVEHLRKHQKRFEQFIVDMKYEEYLEEMSKNGTWADDVEIRAMEEILDRNIHIYSSNSTNPKDYLQPVNENPEEEKLMQGVVPLNLSYHGQSHYNSIYSERNPLPLPVRKTKVLLNARIALFEGRSVPVPTNHPHHPQHSHPHHSNSNNSISSSQSYQTPGKKAPGYQPVFTTTPTPAAAITTSHTNNPSSPGVGSTLAGSMANQQGMLYHEVTASSAASMTSANTASSSSIRKAPPLPLPSSSNHHSNSSNANTNNHPIRDRTRPATDSNHHSNNNHHTSSNSHQSNSNSNNRNYPNNHNHNNHHHSTSSTHQQQRIQPSVLSASISSAQPSSRHQLRGGNPPPPIVQITTPRIPRTATESTDESTPNVSVNYSGIYADPVNPGPSSVQAAISSIHHNPNHPAATSPSASNYYRDDDLPSNGIVSQRSQAFKRSQTNSNDSTSYSSPRNGQQRDMKGGFSSNQSITSHTSNASRGSILRAANHYPYDSQQQSPNKSNSSIHSLHGTKTINKSTSSGIDRMMQP